MIYSFTDILPDNLDIDPLLISGYESLHSSGKEYLLVTDSKTSLYEIRYKAHCSPFKDAIIVDNILAVGHEEHFYLFDIVSKTNILRLEMRGYFGHIYFDNSVFIVADSGGLYSINRQGKINWRNVNLGIDGLIVTEFTEDKIYGSGDWDPPGGWRDFILDKKNGLKIE